MSLKKILSLKQVCVDLQSSTKEAVIEELVDLMVAASKRLDKKVVLDAVQSREAQMSTGMKNGIAIPHGKTDEVRDLHAVVGLSRAGVDFDCMDGELAHIFVMTVSPASRTGPHLQFLAEVSRLLTQEDLRRKMMAAGDAESLLKILWGDV